MIEKLKNYHIILASGSPRRKELLSQMGVDFEIITRKADENLNENYNAVDAAIYLAELKSSAFSDEELLPDKLLITADTIVAVENKILGKPLNENDAEQMLNELSGKCHDVITGVCLRTSDIKRSFAADTRVYFKQLSKAEIDYYIKHYKPFDKAGAYGIQEWIGHIAIDRIEGSYFNVMGLPTHMLWDELGKIV